MNKRERLDDESHQDIQQYVDSSAVAQATADESRIAEEITLAQIDGKKMATREKLTINL